MAIKFIPETHKYISTDVSDITWTSVTSFISKFKQPFDADAISLKVSKSKKSKWYGMSVEDIKTAWANEAKRATDLGTWYHNQRETDICALESIGRNGVNIPVFIPNTNNDGSKTAPDQKLTEGIYPEHMVYLKSAGLCGQSDVVEVVNKKISIVDFKGLALDTPIPTNIGFKLMQDIKVGDTVFDGNGKLTKVEHVSKIHHNPCYKITFDTNEELICDHEHKWLILERISKGSRYSTNYTVNYIEKEYTTEELFNKKNKGEILRIKCVSINTKEKNLPLDPYILGLWLGDGSKQSGSITNMNENIWKEIEKRGYSLGKDVSQNGSGKAQTKTIFGIYPILKKLNLINNKKIPDVYLRGSYEQRLDLLRGMMDSDGYYNKTRKRCVMNTTQKWQADGTMELVSSLGIKSTLINTYAVCNGIKTKAYHVTFRIDDFSPFLCRNEEVNVNMLNLHKYQKEQCRLIKSIVLINTVPTKCISVKSDTHSYLAGKNYIKTHNTNKKIETESFKDWDGKSKKMLHPVSHLDDVNFNHYALQLSMYMYMIIKHNPLYKPGEMCLHHIIFKEAGKDKYGNPIAELDVNGNPIVLDVIKYNVPYLKQEVISLINYKKENDNGKD